jgi:hypothetical protein
VMTVVKRVGERNLLRMTNLTQKISDMKSKANPKGWDVIAE